MTIDRKLLEILVCPVTKQPVSVLTAGKLETLNLAIEGGSVLNHGGGQVTGPLREALITKNGSTVYPVIDGIPVMLEDESIDTVQLGDW